MEKTDDIAGRQGVGTPAADGEEALRQRVCELEIKASFAEDLLEQLDKTVFRQQRQIEALARELAELKRRMPDGGASAALNLSDDLPPHY